MGVVTRAGEWYVAEHACLDERAVGPLRSNPDYVDVPLAQDSNLTSMHRRVSGTLLIFTVNMGFPYNVDNIAHLAFRAFPVFEALQELKSARGPDLGDVDTVLAWQYGPRHNQWWKRYDWFESVLKLVGGRGLGTNLLLDEDLPSGVCARRMLTLMRTPGKKWGSAREYLFSKAIFARAFREHALQALGLPDELRVQKPKCTALVVVRDPPQGWVNSRKVNSQLARLLDLYGWSLRVWCSSHRQIITFREQVSLFVDVAFSIMGVAAENSNLVFQPPGSAVLAVHKCRVASPLARKAVNCCGFKAFESFPAGCHARPKRFNHSINEQDRHTIDFQADLLPTLVEALVSLSCTH